jgi:hypothetical protein
MAVSGRGASTFVPSAQFGIRPDSLVVPSLSGDVSIGEDSHNIPNLR